MKYAAFLVSALALAGLAGCSTSTPYGPATPNSSYGFSERQIESNRWTVSFRGNSLTDLKTVESYLLYRAAELTTQTGYDYFIMVDRKLDEDSEFRSVGPSRFDVAFSYRYYSPHWGWRPHYDPYFNDMTLREVTRYEAVAEIIMGQGPKPAGNVSAYNAEEVLINLSSQIQRTPPTPY